MRLTQNHLDYWAARRAPRWAGALARQRSTPPIDRLINDHAGIEPDTSRAPAGNVLAILHSVRRREGVAGVRRWLDAMARDPGTVFRPERRAAYCWKWLNRLDRRP